MTAVFEIVPNDAQDVGRPVNFLMAPEQGSIRITSESGDEITLANCPAYKPIYMPTRRIWATGTTMPRVICGYEIGALPFGITS